MIPLKLSKTVLCLLLLTIFLTAYGAKPLSAVPTYAQIDTTNWTTAVAWSPDGTRLAISTRNGSIEIQNTITQAILSLTNNLEHTFSLAWSPDGTKLASGHSNPDVVKIWDTSNGALLHTLVGHNGTVTDVNWASDSIKLVSLGFEDGLLIIWDTSVGIQLTNVPIRETVYAIDWNPTNNRIAVWDWDGLVIWDIKETKAEYVFAFLTPYYGTSIQWSPDGKLIASGDLYATGSETVRIWEAETGKLIQELEGHTDTIMEIAWSPDGSMLASASRDMTVRIWNVSTGQEIAIFTSDDVIFSVDWNPKQNQVVYSGIEGEFVTVTPPALSTENP